MNLELKTLLDKISQIKARGPKPNFPITVWQIIEELSAGTEGGPKPSWPSNWGTGTAANPNSGNKSSSTKHLRSLKIVR